MHWDVTNLGWKVAGEKSNGTKILEQGPFFSIVSREGREKEYWLRAFPVLSHEEEALLADVTSLFQKTGANASSPGLKRFFKRYCIQNLILLEKRQVEYLSLVLEKQLFGFGPIDFLLHDDRIEEIAVTGIGREKPVHVFHTSHGWLKTNFFFLRGSSVRDVVNKMSRGIGRRLSMNRPLLNASLPDGNRLSAAIGPISLPGPSVTIRKFRRQPFTPIQLVANSTFSPELMAFLWIAMQCDCSLLIVGNTGSGKTSSLGALLSFVPSSERIIVVEETPEIRVVHKHFVKLKVVQEQSVGMQSLIVESLRMRPDRVVVGEVRSRQEVAAFIDTLLAGQGKGSYATFHGQSIDEAVMRMKNLGVLEMDLASLDLVVVQRRWNRIGRGGSMEEVRRVIEIGELHECNGKVGCDVLFRFDYGKNRLVQCGKSRKVFEKARRCFGFGKGEWESELKRRAKFLKGMKHGIEIEEFFRAVNRF